MQKTLTILISAYNKELYLERCIESLLIPSLDRLEIIVVNDGSSDSTLEIADKYRAQHPDSIVVVDKANGHQGSCINIGLKLFKGRYFKTLDADDYFATDALEELVETLNRSYADMVITGHKICGTVDTIITPQNVVDGKIYRLNDINFNQLNSSESLGMHGVLFRGEILRSNNISLLEKTPSTDTEYCYYPIRHCHTVQFICRVLYLYQTGVDGQESWQTTPARKSGRYTLVRRMMNDYTTHIVPSKNIRESQRIVMNRAIIGYIEYYTLHYRRNREDHRRVQEILSIVAKDREWWEEIMNAQKYKIKFIQFYHKYGLCIYPLTKLLNHLKSVIRKIKQHDEHTLHNKQATPCD